MMDPLEIKKKIGRFRILIIGRANAGKTTILQRVCNTREDPEIYNSAGKKIDTTILTASKERGHHDIENEMVFRSNPEFVFHDSCGFEAGSESEYDKVNSFINARSKETDIKHRIHIIWYCIPMDEPSRWFTAAEVEFFSHCDTGSIPVIVLFTKFDALYDIAFARLIENGTSRKDAIQLAPKHAEEIFANGPQLKFLYNFKTIRRPPKCHICLSNMFKDDADCGPLIKRTAETLDNEVLQQLFISSQQTNLEFRMKYAVENTQAGREWLDGPNREDWLQTPAGRDWLQTKGGGDWLQTKGGGDWLQTQGGGDWLQSQSGREWLCTQSGQEWLQIQGGQDWLQTQRGRDWLETLSGRDWLQTPHGQLWQSASALWQGHSQPDADIAPQLSPRPWLGFFSRPAPSPRTAAQKNKLRFTAPRPNTQAASQGQPKHPIQGVASSLPSSRPQAAVATTSSLLMPPPVATTPAAVTDKPGAPTRQAGCCPRFWSCICCKSTESSDGFH